MLLNAVDSRSFPPVKLTDGPFKRGDPQRGQRKREEESSGGWIQRVPRVIPLFSVPVAVGSVPEIEP
jgi:hypothetical protein